MPTTMDNFDIKLLSTEDGSWEAFKEDWQDQCDEVGEDIDDYSPQILKLIEGTVLGTDPTAGGPNDTRVGALWDGDRKHFYAVCILNRTMIPRTPGYTLRVRHMIVSPLLDYGVGEIQMYPDVVIAITLGIVKLSETVLNANSIRFHLRSPEDVAYFRAFGSALGERKVFASVKAHGAWLYIERLAAVGTAAVEEAE